MNKAKRIYQTVSVREKAGIFSVFLDGRTAKTPAGSALSVPTRALGQAIADEWDAQKEHIDPDSMPLTRLAASALDRIGMDRATIVDRVVAFSKSDLLCYRAERPDELIDGQAALWQPILDWVNETHGAGFVVTTGVVPIAQSSMAVERVREAIDGFDDFTLAALSSATSACGSVFLGLALIAGRIDAEEAGEAALLDEIFQAEQWGEDKEASARRRALRTEIRAARRFVDLLEIG